jgi:hypothetical protein
MNVNIRNLYEIQCSNAMYDCIILVVTPSIYLAKKQIIENFINLDISKYISNFKPYKSRLQLNIPLLQQNICHHLYSILNQFYEVGTDNMYHTIEYTGASHLDINELVIKISTILSNKILGKNIIKNVESISNDTFYL